MSIFRKDSFIEAGFVKFNGTVKVDALLSECFNISKISLKHVDIFYERFYLTHTVYTYIIWFACASICMSVLPRMGHSF